MDTTTDHYGKTDEGNFVHYRWEQVGSGRLVTTNPNGSTGWVRIVRSGDRGIVAGKLMRWHRCAQNPCEARWDATKYGMAGPPIHVQPVGAGDASFGPASAELPTGAAPAPAPFDPQLRMEVEQQRGDAAAAEHRVYSRIWDLAMEIQSDFHYVGYVFFVLMGLLKKCQPCVWEGPSRVNLLEHYATWAMASAVAECATDGVVCCMRARPEGIAEMVPVSGDHPLNECRHFVACHKLAGDLRDCGDTIQAFYGRLGIVLLGTAADGDCGPDTACIMLSRPQTLQERRKLRHEVADYLRERYNEPWMHELLVVCQEMPIEWMHDFRSSGAGSDPVPPLPPHPPPAAPLYAAAGGNEAAVAALPDTGANVSLEESVETFRALEWSTQASYEVP